MKIPLHKIPADVRCKMLPCCHIVLKFIGVLCLGKWFIFRKLFKWYFRDDVYQRIDWLTTMARIFFRQNTRIIFTHIRIHIGYALSDITIKNCAYVVAFWTTDSLGYTCISKEANGKRVKRDVYIYGTFWLTETTKSSVKLADTWRDANQCLALPVS